MIDERRNDIPDSLRARLLKTLELARRGIGGEQETAQRVLEALLRKHNLSLADLEEIERPPLEWMTIQCASEQELTVLTGVLIVAAGVKVEALKSSDFMVTARLSAAQRAAVTVLWDVYSAAWQAAVEDLSIAFCYRHQLFDTDEARRISAETERPSPPSRAEALKAQRRRDLADSLEHVDRPVGRLGGLKR